jgi:hypothetical protein
VSLRDVLERWRDSLLRPSRPTRGRGASQRRAASVASDHAEGVFLPQALHGLVHTHRADVAGGILRALADGREECTVGIGPRMDIPLLPDDLVAADVSLVERDLLVLSVRWTADGWMLIRDTSNFGVFWATKNEPSDWSSVRRCSAVQGLAPGDLLGLGSCPGDSLVCRLPAPPDGVAFAPLPDVLALWALEERLRVAVSHWRYATLRLEANPDAEVPLPPACGGARLTLTRDLDAPTAGWALAVDDVGEGLATSGLEGGRHDLRAGDRLQLVGAGHVLVFGQRVALGVPPSLAPTPRFDQKNTPSRADIREVLCLGPHDLDDPAKVKAAWKDAARRFHPDKVGNEPGPISRFVEARACFEAYQRLRTSADDDAL